MALENRLELKLAQKLVLTPQLQMAIRLLHMPQLELSQTLNEELTENPLLEESMDFLTAEDLTPEEKDSYDVAEAEDDTEMPLEKMISFGSEDYFEEKSLDGRDLGYFNPGNVTQPTFETFASEEADLYDHLTWQLRLSRDDETTRSVAEIIIGNLDDNGYLRLSAEELKGLSQADDETIEKALQLVQSFDPPGIGARDITECLCLQLRPLNLAGSLVETLIRNDLELIGKKKYPQLSKKYAVALDEIMAAIKVIEGLDPKPARNFSSFEARYVVPDVYVVKTDAGYQIVLNDDGMPKLRISSYYQKLLQQKDAVEKEDRQFLEDKLRSAIWLLKSLAQRNKTIYRVTESILDFQRDFFDSGVNHLKPLNLKDVATRLSLHESTISRVTSNKYLSCSQGIFSFKFFFSNSIPGEAGGISSTSIKEMIRKIISEEDPGSPLSDMRIVDIFRSQNTVIARRTIAKYREELKIPSHTQRKKVPSQTTHTTDKGENNEHYH